MSDATVLVGGVIAIVVLLACSALFSSAETAIFSLPLDWIQGAAKEGGSGAILADLRADPHRLLVTLLVGNNVVNIAIASVVTVLVGRYLPAGPAIVFTTAATSCIVLVCGEILPKSYGLGQARSWAIRVAPVLRAVEWFLWPAITVFDSVTRRIATRLGAKPDIESAYV